MISLKNVRLRAINRENKKVFSESHTMFNLPFYKDIALNKGKEYYIDKIIDNWENIFVDQNQSFETLINILDKYFTKYPTYDKNSILYRLKKEVIPKLQDIKSNIRNVNEFANKYDKEVLSLMEMYKQCDRVLNNHKKLNMSKTKNFDNCIREMYISDNQDSIVDCVHELCEIINSYNMPFNTKFNVALENIFYGLDTFTRSSDTLNSKLVLDTIVTTFSQYDYDNNIVNMRDILANNKFISDDIKESVAYLYDSDSVVYIEGKEITKNNSKYAFGELKKLVTVKTPQALSSGFKAVLKKFYTKSDKNIIEDTPNFFNWFRFLLVCGTFAVQPVLGLVTVLTDFFIHMTQQRAACEEMVKKYEKELAKTKKKATGKNKEKYDALAKEIEENLEKIKDYQDTLYTEKENDKRHENDYDDILESALLHIDSVSIIDYFKNYHRLVSDEIQKIYNRIINFNSDYIIPITKDELNKFLYVQPQELGVYLDQDERIFIKLADWDCDLHRHNLSKTISNPIDVDRMMRDILNNICETLSDVSEDFFIYYDGLDNWHIYACLNTAIYDSSTNDVLTHVDYDDIYDFIELGEAMMYSYNNPISSVIESNIEKMSNSDIKSLGKALLGFNIINYDDIINVLSKEKDRLLGTTNNSKYIKSSTISQIIWDLKEKAEYDGPISYLNEYSDLAIMINAINEGKVNKFKIKPRLVKNKMKVVASRAKNMTAHAIEKEKIASNKLDNFFEKFKDKIDRELTNKNREAVIKGTVVPSLSSLIKMGLASGIIGAAVNPILGAITFAAGLVCSKRATAKEKQYILDEIEIQLTVVDKKIQLAESNNDMKALESLLKIQKRLRREKQRIIYNGRARNFRRDID